MDYPLITAHPGHLSAHHSPARPLWSLRRRPIVVVVLHAAPLGPLTLFPNQPQTPIHRIPSHHPIDQAKLESEKEAAQSAWAAQRRALEATIDHCEARIKVRGRGRVCVCPGLVQGLGAGVPRAHVRVRGSGGEGVGGRRVSRVADPDPLPPAPAPAPWTLKRPRAA